MSTQSNSVTRRDFMKRLGVAGAALGASPVLGQPNAAPATAPAVGSMPLRTFGKTGVKVPILALGGIFDITSNQLVLQRALDFGVTYWDTASGYTNGNSEKGIGLFLERNPNARKQLFIVTKCKERNAQGMTERLEESLQRMKTDYVDLYFVHGVRSGSELTEDVKAWAEKMKAANKIRFIGFSTHNNMAECLQAAAKTGWIDGVMPKYDFRLMHTDEMRAAVDACAKAGIGLTAMKTQSKESFNLDNEADLKLGGHFVKRGFTDHQARLKAVWEDPHIASICSQMANVTILSANVAAALDKTSLTAADHDALRAYADATCSGHCAGCSDVCENVLGRGVPIGDVMRSMMYHHGYNDHRLARETFAQVPAALRETLAALDYSAAEQVCPHRLPIARLMRQAAELLA